MPIRPASRAFTLEVDHVLPAMTMAPRKLGGSGRACQPDGRPAAARVRVLGDTERPVPCALGTHAQPGDTAQNGGYARASYASGGGGASRVPRIAGDVTAALPLSAACWWAMRGKAPLLICSGAASRRELPYGGSTRFYGGSTRRQGHLGRFTGLRCGDWRGAAGGCHCASLMMKRRAAATAVRPCARPGPGSPLSSFPQVTCLNRSGRPVLPPLFACEMRARRALAVLAWSGDGSPVWGCTTTSGVQVPPRTQ
jgi:hypothetical protein